MIAIKLQVEMEKEFLFWDSILPSTLTMEFNKKFEDIVKSENHIEVLPTDNISEHDHCTVIRFTTTEDGDGPEFEKSYEIIIDDDLTHRLEWLNTDD